MQIPVILVEDSAPIFVTVSAVVLSTKEKARPDSEETTQNGAFVLVDDQLIVQPVAIVPWVTSKAVSVEPLVTAGPVPQPETVTFVPSVPMSPFTVSLLSGVVVPIPTFPPLGFKSSGWKVLFDACMNAALRFGS